MVLRPQVQLARVSITGNAKDQDWDRGVRRPLQGRFNLIPVEQGKGILGKKYGNSVSIFQPCNQLACGSRGTKLQGLEVEAVEFRQPLDRLLLDRMGPFALNKNYVGCEGRERADQQKQADGKPGDNSVFSHFLGCRDVASLCQQSRQRRAEKHEGTYY